jgi:cytochrome c-type biogenesis protein CcmH
MILFWVLCASLLVIALSFVLPPLLKRLDDGANEVVDRQQANITIYRDQLSELEADLNNGIVSREQYEQDRDEIQRRLLEDTKPGPDSPTFTTTAAGRGTVYVIAIGLPLVAILFYLKVGELKGLSYVPSAPVAQSEPGMQEGGRSQQQIEANVAALAKRLQENPSDGEGWHTLGRSYSAMERWSEAAQAYEKATAIITNDADLWAEYAFTTAMASGRQLQGKPMELVNKALKIDPENLKALELSGSAAYQAKDYKKAIEIWQRVLSKVPPGSDVAGSLNTRITEAKEQLNEK